MLLADSLDGIFPQESFDGKTLYFAAREVRTKLLKLSLNAPFSDSQVEGMPVVLDSDLWTLAPSGIYFVPVISSLSVDYFDFASKKTRELFRVQKPFGGGLSLSPDGRYLLYSQVDEENSDIMLVDPFG